MYIIAGINSYHSKDAIAEAHQLQPDSIKQKFSTAQLYGLLELKHGTGYKLTQKFLKVFKPISDEEKKQGILECLQSSDIYSILITDFNGHPLPSESGLSSRLIRNFQIKDYAATKAAAIFLSNLKDNGFVGANNQLNITLSELAKGNGAEHGQKDEFHEKPKEHQPPVPEHIDIPVPLKGGRRAWIKIPEDYTSEDCERIAKFVEALK